MTQCLKEMLLLTDHGPAYIIIDDLDECPNASGVLSAREQVLQHLIHLTPRPEDKGWISSIQT